MFLLSERYMLSWNMTLNTTWFVRSDKKETFERRKEPLKLIKTMIERALIKVFYLNDKPKCSVTVFDCIQRVYSLLFFMCGVCCCFLFILLFSQWNDISDEVQPVSMFDSFYSFFFLVLKNVLFFQTNL